MSRITRKLIVSLTAVGLVTLAACDRGGGGGEAKTATQVAAKVNKDEITVHQIHNALPRMNNPSQEQTKAAEKQVLERLVDQQLLIQKANEAKLDRDPQVMTAMENAKREILARAYVERVMANAPKAKPEEVKAFFGKHPELFAERKIYRLQEVVVQLKPEQTKPLRDAMGTMKTLQDVANYAKTNSIPFQANNSVRAAEQLPMEFAGKLATMKDGDIVAIPSPTGMSIVQIAQSQSQPLNEQQATPFIEQFLQNKQRMELAQAELKKLRESAKIEYVGDYVKPTEGAAAPAAENATPEQTAQPQSPTTQSQDFLEKGLQGLKK